MATSGNFGREGGLGMTGSPESLLAIVELILSRFFVGRITKTLPHRSAFTLLVLNGHIAVVFPVCWGALVQTLVLHLGVRRRVLTGLGEEWAHA
jgi:hypothetical protein